MAATYNDNVIGVDLTKDYSTQEFALGKEVKGTSGSEWLFVKAGSAVTQYFTVGIDEDHNAYPLTKAMADDGWRVGFAQVALTKDNYGWVAVKGSDIKAFGLAGCLPDVALYTSGTAGKLDDTSASQTKINGLVFVTTASGAAAEVIASFPRSTTF